MIFVTDMDTGIKALVEQVEILKKKADDVIPTPMKVEAYDTNKLLTRQFSFESFWKEGESRFFSGVTTDLNERRYKELLCAVETDKETILCVQQRNEESLRVNKLIHEKIKLIFSTIGIRETYSTWAFKTSRSSNKTETKHKAGYIEDLNRCIPITCGYQQALRIIEANLSNATVHYNKVRNELLKKDREKQLEDKKLKAASLLANMQVKYGLRFDCSLDDVLSVVVSSCKYLQLAHAMKLTREDWNDGFYRVRNAKEEFSVDITNKEDGLIIKCVSDILEGDEDDGRVFRDCEFNYNVLFGMVDSNLIEDYNTICEHTQQD